MKPSNWFALVLTVSAVFPALANDKKADVPVKDDGAVLMLDASPGHETAACLVTAGSAPLFRPNRRPDLPSCSNQKLPPLFLKQGHRTELRVYNRRFLSDYNITIDNVTTLTGPQIRNLAEAENLSLGAPSLIPPPSKGGFETITQRTAGDILALLLDETQATKPLADLDADFGELRREYAQLRNDVGAFEQNYRLLLGDSSSQLDCQKISGSPDANSLLMCLGEELKSETEPDRWKGPGPYADEQEFRNVTSRVQDLLVTIKTFSGVIASTKIVQLAQQLDAEATQYEKNFITFRQNIESAKDAARLLNEMNGTPTQPRQQQKQQATSLRTELRLAQIRASLAKSLKPPLDDAEISQLLGKYKAFLEKEGKQVTLDQGSALEDRAAEVDPNCLPAKGQADCLGRTVQDPARHPSVRDRVDRARRQVEVELPKVLDDINAAQGRLLTRVNYIYDYSQVPDARQEQIDISGHSGNLIVYYTIRRIENFARFRVAQVQGAGSAAPASVQGTSVPTPAGSTPAPNTPVTPATTGTPAAGAVAPADTGTVVAHGSFYVHDLYRANVVAAFAYSRAKDQNIVKQPEPGACGGSPDCFSPLLNDKPSQLNLILGVDYYFHHRDTFYDVSGDVSGAPQRSPQEWLLQSTGIMGALSATKANNWFLGLFFEPVLGVQVGGGANFTSEKRLQKNFQFGTPVVMTGDFPTQDVRVTKAFVSAGLDLGLFRKIFGKLTGIGAATAATQGN